MMMKPLLLSFFMCMISICCLAQEHNTAQFAVCKYNKNLKKFSHEGGTACAKCVLDDKKEKEARVVENKRRLVEAAAKLKEEKRIQDLADKKKREEEAKKNQVTEVFITAPKTTASAKEPKQTANPKRDLLPGNSAVLTGATSSSFFHINNHNYYANYFLNRNKDTVLRNSEWKQTFGENDHYPQLHYPEGIGIVELTNTKKITGKRNAKMPICDLVDGKGKRMLNNDSISAIVHFTHDWFVICKQYFQKEGYGNGFYAENTSIYNIRTKETIKVPDWNDNSTNILGKVYLFTTAVLINDKDERPRGSFNMCLSTQQNFRECTLYYALKDGSIEIESFNYN